MDLINNRFTIQGLDVEEICSKYGTPLYVYDAEKITSQYQKLKNAFEGVNVKIKYAAKALTNQAILKLLRKIGSGIDVVSIEEVRLGLLAGFEKSNMMFTPSCVSFDEIKEAVSLGVTINIDSLSFLDKFGKEYGSSYPCCIRINPYIDAGGNAKIMTGHRESKFGISVEQTEEIYQTVTKYNINVSGIHVHSGSDFKDADAFVKATEIIFNIAKRYPNLKFLDFGSGFKVPYKKGDYSTDLNDLGTKMKNAFSDFCKSYGRDLELWFEPGKFLVSESGVLFVKVNVVKENPGLTFVGIDSGLNHLIRPMMYNAYHDILNVSNPVGEVQNYNVVGYICETDTFGTDRPLTKVTEGNILAIKNAGAYGFSMSSNYNSRLRPAEVLIYNKEAILIRKRESFEDLLKHQIDVTI